MTITDRAAIVLQEIDSALKMAEKATDGPWVVVCGFTVQQPSYPFRVVAELDNAETIPTEREIDANFIAAARTGWPKSLHCLKTAIEGQLRWLFPGNADTLTTLCDLWDDTK
jgi:hypothetical protein